MDVAGVQLLGNAQHLHLAQLHFGDVGAGADNAAVVGPLFGDQDPAAVGELHLDRLCRIAMPLDAPGDILVRVTCR